MVNMPPYLTLIDFNMFNMRISKIKGGGPKVVVSTAAFHARVRG